MLLVLNGFIVVVISTLVGMIASFIISKKGKLGDEKNIEELCSRSLARGYLGGCIWSVMSCLLTSSVLYFLINKSGLSDSEIYKSIFYIMGSNVIFSIIGGLLFYLPVAYIGYNLLTRRLAEEKIAQDHGT